MPIFYNSKKLVVVYWLVVISSSLSSSWFSQLFLIFFWFWAIPDFFLIIPEKLLISPDFKSLHHKKNYWNIYLFHNVIQVKLDVFCEEWYCVFIGLLLYIRIVSFPQSMSRHVASYSRDCLLLLSVYFISLYWYWKLEDN